MKRNPQIRFSVLLGKRPCIRSPNANEASVTSATEEKVNVFGGELDIWGQLINDEPTNYIWNGTYTHTVEAVVNESNTSQIFVPAADLNYTNVTYENVTYAPSCLNTAQYFGPY